MTNRTKIGAGILALLLVIGGFFAVRALTGKDETASQPSVSATLQAGDPNDSQGGDQGNSGATATNAASATNKGAKKALPEGCMDTRVEIEPTSFAIDEMKVTSPMMPVADDGDTGGAPPKNQPRTVGWRVEGPKVGAKQGHVVLTIHTYRNGGALGNEMYNGGKGGFQDGNLVRMTDKQGRTQCYTLTKHKKIWVKDYDPNSSEVYNSTGAHQAVIVICWDFNKKTEDWDSRIVYYLDPLAA